MMEKQGLVVCGMVCGWPIVWALQWFRIWPFNFSRKSSASAEAQQSQPDHFDPGAQKR